MQYSSLSPVIDESKLPFASAGCTSSILIPIHVNNDGSGSRGPDFKIMFAEVQRRLLKFAQDDQTANCSSVEDV